MSLLIKPLSSTLVSDIFVMFPEVYNKHTGYGQLRRGRFVINLCDSVPYECLVLNEFNSVIDGFIGSPLPFIKWRGEPMVEHLRRLFNLDFLNGYDEVWSKDKIEEYVLNLDEEMFNER